MNTKLILATLAGAILSFLLGWLVYGILLAGFMEANTLVYEGLNKSEPLMVHMIIGGLAIWFFIAFVFQRWAGFTTLPKGFAGGLMFGFFIAVYFDLYLYSMMNLFSYKFIIVDILVSTVLNGIIGGVVAWILGFKGKTVQP